MDVVMPQLGETVKEGTVTVWHKKVGEQVEANEPLFGVNTDKVETEVPAPVSGVLSAILVSEGTTVEVGATLAVIEEAGKPRKASAEPPEALPSGPRLAESLPRQGGEPPLSPVVRRLLAEHGLQPSDIRGTGAGGRITRDDVLSHVEKSQPARAALSSLAVSASDFPRMVSACCLVPVSVRRRHGIGRSRQAPASHGPSGGPEPAHP